MERTMDQIKDRYGSDAVLRASSLLEAGVARERAANWGAFYMSHQAKGDPWATRFLLKEHVEDYLKQN